MIAEDVAKKIRALEIQGATATAVEAVKALREMEHNDKSRDEIEAGADVLKNARPTEPALRNAIDHVLETGDYETVLTHFRQAKQQIAATGAAEITDGDTIYTHCHSSTVVAVVKAAHEEKDVLVHNTETRPVYQGRKTARKLADHGVPVEHFVDSAAKVALTDADLMLIGADAVTMDGDVYNKIGSALIGEAAHDLDVPIYVCTDSWKLDPDTADGGVDVEERTATEVWDTAPENVDVRNPAFEKVDAQIISGIMTEKGVIDPGNIGETVRKSYPAIFQDQ